MATKKEQIENLIIEKDQIKIGDKEYKVYFSLASFKYIAKNIEGGISGLQEAFKNLDIKDFDENKIDCIIDLIYAGLLSCNKDITKEEIENTLQIKDMLVVLNILMINITKSLPENDLKNA